MHVIPRARSALVCAAVALASAGCGTTASSVSAGTSTASAAARTEAEVIAEELAVLETSGRAVHASDLNLREIAVTEPLQTGGGRGLLSPPTVPPRISAADALATFVDQVLPSDSKGKVVEARFGLYRDISIGVQQPGQDFTPTFTDTAVWILRVQGLAIAPAGPVDPGRPTTNAAPPAADHDLLGIIDADTGAFLYAIEEGTGASFQRAAG